MSFKNAKLRILQGIGCFIFIFYFFLLFSVSEPEGQLHYCYHVSVVNLSYFRLVQCNRWTEWIYNLTGSKISTSSTKFMFFFGPIGKARWPSASDLLRHFRLLLWNNWREFDETWQEARFLTSSTMFVFSGQSEKPRWPHWSVIGWDNFDFPSETSRRNMTKLERK